MNWIDPASDELTEGFKEKGFLPEAFINMLVTLGWNDGTEQEIFSLSELIQKFSIDRVHKAGAKFDYEKAKWFNHEWIKRFEIEGLRPRVKDVLEDKGIRVSDDVYLDKIITLIRDRCSLLPDFYEQGCFFFKAPSEWDVASVRPKWSAEKKQFFEILCEEFDATPDWQSAFIEAGFKTIAAGKNIKPGEVQLPFRIMLVGGKFGPPVFDIAELIGKEETNRRIRSALDQF
jgi:glutamyl-tRNA synthetase